MISNRCALFVLMAVLLHGHAQCQIIGGINMPCSDDQVDIIATCLTRVFCAQPPSAVPAFDIGARAFATCPNQPVDDFASVDATVGGVQAVATAQARALFFDRLIHKEIRVGDCSGANNLIFFSDDPQGCDPPPPPPPPGGCTTVPLATLPAKLSTGPTGSLNTTPPLECDPNIETCTCDPNPSSPIIIDLTGDGFSLTDVAHGVKFDISGAGNPVQIAWTANSNNAFLALDRDGSGTITSGAELFGNFTSQPSSKNPNGFLALAVYDDPANGGNGDGIIDARDQIFSKLRLWVDANHDGIDQPGELHTLPEMGIYSINLDYSLSERTDQYGNVFRYKAHINQGLHGPSDVGKTAYDVFLITQ
jgi:hypothetical protein